MKLDVVLSRLSFCSSKEASDVVLSFLYLSYCSSEEVVDVVLSFLYLSYCSSVEVVDVVLSLLYLFGKNSSSSPQRNAS